MAKQSFRRRFWSYVLIGDDCWMWTGSTDGGGYGHIKRDSRAVPAHRVAWEFMRGEIPPGAVMDHICRERRCVNPGHLRITDYRGNSENRPAEGTCSRTGLRGVKRRGRRYCAEVISGGRYYWGGSFPTLQEAAEAVRQLRNDLMVLNDDDRR